jgi:hypothetical protein
MKRKAFKINQNTLFVYKSARSYNGKSITDSTDPTTTMTITPTGTSRVMK